MRGDEDRYADHPVQALRNADIPDDTATAVVDQLEEFIAVKISEANKGLEERLKGLDAKISALTWFVGAVGVIVSVAALLASVSPLFHR